MTWVAPEDKSRAASARFDELAPQHRAICWSSGLPNLDHRRARIEVRLDAAAFRAT